MRRGGAHLLLFGGEPGVFLTGLFSRLSNVELLVTGSLVALDPVCEVQLPSRGSQLGRAEDRLQGSCIDVSISRGSARKGKALTALGTLLARLGGLLHLVVLHRALLLPNSGVAVAVFADAL